MSIWRMLLPTNALTAAFTRIRYGSEPLYPEVDPDLLQPPHPDSAAKKATEYLLESSLRQSDSKPFSVSDNLRGKIQLKSECGIGIWLYFFSLKYFAGVFAVLTIFGIAQASLSYDGAYYEEKYGDWSVYFPCWGNAPAISRLNSTTLEDAQEVFEEISSVKEKQVVLDATYTFLLLVSILTYSMLTKVIIERHRRDNPSLADYAVKFTQVPEAFIPHLALSLEACGICIHEMVPVRHVNRLLSHFQLYELWCKKRILDHFIEPEEATNIALEPPESINRRMSVHLAEGELLDGAKTAERQDRDNGMKRDEPHKREARRVERQNPGGEVQERHQRYAWEIDQVHFRLTMLRSLPWENDFLEVGHSVIVVFRTREDRSKALKRYRKNWMMSLVVKVKVWIQKQFDLPRNWESEINAKWLSVPEEIYWENIKKKQYVIRLLFSWVSALLILGTGIAIFGLREKQNDVKEESEEVDHQDDRNASLQRRVQSGSIKFLLSICITVINSIIPWVLNVFLTSMEKQSTLPRVKLSAMMKNFFFMLINTCFVILLVNADFSQYDVNGMLPMVDSRFRDFSRDWYLEVGFSILMSMLLFILFPHCSWVLYYFIKHQCLPRALKYFDTQLAYNHWATGRPIDLPQQTAIILVIIFCCLMYSGGMPLMLPICSLALCAIFIAETVMLRFTMKSKEMSTILHTWFVNLLPWAVVLHCLFSAYMYGAESIAPHESPDSWSKHHSHFTSSEYLDSVSNSYTERASDYCGVVFLCLAGAATLVGVFLRQIQRRVRKLIHINSVPVTDILKEVKGGDSYYMTRNKKYEKFFQQLVAVEELEEEGEVQKVDEGHPKLLSEELVNVLKEGER